MPKGKEKKKVTILWGLPGSGKTEYAKPFKRNLFSYKRNHDSDVLDLDDKQRLYKGLIEEPNIRTWSSCVSLSAINHLVIDGLITTNKVAKAIIDAVKVVAAGFDLDFEIVWWEADIEACLHNDKYRRQISSEASIKNMPFEKPDAKFLGIEPTKIFKKKVYRKKLNDFWSEEYGVENNIMKSEKWSTGGTQCGYTGTTWNVSADPQPVNFKEFDDLLEKICPNISFLQYKKLYNHTVKVETWSESDYYGGSVGYANYVCDLLKLYEMMLQMGVIHDDES